jgi:RHS repeat-associated protein
LLTVTQNSQASSGSQQTRTYDAMHRPLTITYSTSSPTVTTPNKCFVYDAVIDSQTTTYTKSRLAEAYTTTSACSITTLPTTITDESFSYTKRGELTSVYELTPHTSPSYYQVFQTYWANHAPNVLSGNIGLPTITYGVEGEGRISAISASAGQNPVTSTTYNMYASPNQLTVNFGSGDSDVFSYDPSTMRMNKYQFKIGSQTIIGTLGWNANWSLGSLNISDPFSTTNTQNCSYTADDLARIIQVSCGTTWGQNFAYDPFGNIQKNAISGTGATSFTPTYASSPATNRVASVGGNSASYDANGNSLNDTFRAFTWDAENRPVTIGSAITVAYDALGRAVEQSVSSTYSEVVYSPAGVKLALMNAMTLAKAFVPLTAGDAAVYTSSTGPAYYRHTDHLGSSRFASTTSQTLYADSAYSPFGEPYSTSGAIDLSFTEENEDTTAGLYDFLHREYDPNQSRWTSPDPAGLAAARPSFPQSWNRYAYVLNNPLASVDPAGYDCVYLNDAGNDTEYIDTESDVGGCGLDGGYWIPGTVDPNSVTIFTDSGWITTDSNTGLGTFASPCSGAGCGLDATNNNWLTPSTFGSSGILADSPGNWLNADSTTGMPTMAGLSYSDQLFGALIQGAYMAEPGINAALAITAPQDLLIAVDAALLLPEVSSGTACVAGSVGYGAAVGYLGSQSENSYNNALYGGPVANGSAYATALGGGTGYLTGAATCPP